MNASGAVIDTKGDLIQPILNNKPYPLWDATVVGIPAFVDFGEIRIITGGYVGIITVTGAEIK